MLLWRIPQYDIEEINEIIGHANTLLTLKLYHQFSQLHYPVLVPPRTGGLCLKRVVFCRERAIGFPGVNAIVAHRITTY